MKRVYTERDVRRRIAGGEDPSRIPDGAVVTPSARDAIRAWQSTARESAPAKRAPVAVQSGGGKTESTPAAESFPSTGALAEDGVFRWRPGQDPADSAAVRSFYVDSAIVALRRRMAASAFNLWQRGWFDGGLNQILVRVGDTLALTLRELSSASMIDADKIRLTRISGRAVEGVDEPSHCLESLLGVFRAQHAARVVLFATPPHATALAVAKVRPPACALAQAEVVVGQVGLAESLLPDSPDGAAVLGDLCLRHMAVLLPYQGVVTWGASIEEALIRLEQTENLCRTLSLAAPVGGQFEPMPGSTVRMLLEKRRQLGFADPRLDLKECELCDSGEFLPGVVCRPSAANSSAAESLVQELTDAVMKQLRQ